MLNLTAIAKRIMNEDAAGNNVAATSPQNPGKSPTAVPPQPSPDVKYYDVNKDYQSFKNAIEAQDERIKKDFKTVLSKNLVGKSVTAKASKGAVGQVEKEYQFSVIGVDVMFMKDKYYVVLKGQDKKDYYINDGFKIKLEGESADNSETPNPEETPTPEKSKKPSVGGIVYPQNIGVSSPKNQFFI